MLTSEPALRCPICDRHTASPCSPCSRCYADRLPAGAGQLTQAEEADADWDILADATAAFAGRAGLTLARSTDPGESRQAADEIIAHLPTLQAHAVALIRQSPGRTVSELADEYGIRDPRRIGRRLSELWNRGLVRKKTKLCSITGRNAAGWWLA